MTVDNGGKGHVGFYGKLPMLGDFITRRLPNDFIVPWDNWLQNAIAVSREEIGDAWLNSYLTSPIWRFVLSPGVCGDQAVAGIIMPSVDKVGRYYPLTVALLFDQAPDLPFLFTQANAWFEQLEDAALTGLEGNLDINGFDQLVQGIPRVHLPVRTTSLPLPAGLEQQFYARVDNPARVADAFVGLNAQLLANFVPIYSLWSNAGSEHVQAALLTCAGLPPISSYAAFLKGIVDHKGGASGPKPPAAETPGQVPESASVLPSLSSLLGDADESFELLPWRSWAITDTGKRRKHNEDALLNKPEVGLWAVADGMGGHKAGDVASQLIVDALAILPAVADLEASVNRIKDCLKGVNAQLRQLSSQEYDDQLVGSTVVVLACAAGQCAFLWVGDSRLYRYRDKRLQQLTQDHCGIEGIVAEGGATKKTNIITRAMGSDYLLDLDMGTGDVRVGDIFLLCSDGLDKELSFQEIAQLLQGHEPQDIAQALISETLARGARDNVSVIVVAIGPD